tara:strand:- start:3307 stop:4011 length:705 start_codon:yes stop_codon:yes gene_type:complete
MTSGRKYLDNVKSATACVCGEKRKALFEFAHYDRLTKLSRKGKTVDISSLRNEKLIKVELEKGRYLCVSCHRDETYKENAKIVEDHVQYLVLRSTQNHRDNGMKCNGIICQGRHLPKRHFRVYKTKCDSCVSLEKIKKRKERQNYINTIKAQAVCEYCKEECNAKNTHKFEFDHIFGKNCNVSKLRDANVKVVDNEIKLCRLLCAKCHRLKSILESRQQWRENPSDFEKVLYES